MHSLSAAATSRRAFLARAAGLAGAAAVPWQAWGQPGEAALLLMAGAGYRRPMEAICAAFTQETGVAVERSYGNLQQVFSQARASGRVDVLVGDTDFIDKARDLNLPGRLTLGEGIMALGWRRGLAAAAGLAGHEGARSLLAMPGLSVAMPNPQQAVYGNAARQWLQAQQLWAPLQERLKVVGTVPQVSAYLGSGQVDLGFINLTEALALGDQLGGYLRIPPGEGSYAPIEIVAALPEADAHPATRAARERLVAFLRGAKAQDLLRRAGL